MTRVQAVPLASIAANAGTPEQSSAGAADGADDNVVRISIGRIDIRAAVAPPAPQRAEPRAAEPEALSLHTYLRGGRGAQ